MTYKEALNSAIIAPEYQKAFDDALPLLSAAPDMLADLEGEAYLKAVKEASQ